VADPAHGLVQYTREKFLAGWLSASQRGTDLGIVLLLEPTPDFNTTEEIPPADRSGLGFLFNYLRPYRRDIGQLLLGMLVVSLLQLLFPFLTQSLVDVGINQQNIGFVNLILVAQLMLFASRTGVEFIRSWILLHLGTRLNIYILSGFLVKLMRLSIAFFDASMTGDLLQRIGDHRRLETF
jgi:ATP-binding cassette subfamily B protein